MEYNELNKILGDVSEIKFLADRLGQAIVDGRACDANSLIGDIVLCVQNVANGIEAGRCCQANGPN